MSEWFPTLRTVSALLAFREGRMLHHTIPTYLKHSDVLVIMLDNEDYVTEEIVYGYKDKYPDRIRVYHSSFPRATKKQEETPNAMNIRFKKNEGTIRDELLDHVKKENSIFQIDVLIWLDIDEIFIPEAKDIIDRFMHTEKKALRSKRIEMFGDFKCFSDYELMPHCRVFKYDPGLRVTPTKGRAFLHPLKGGDAYVGGRFVIHLADLNVDYIKNRLQYKSRFVKGQELDNVKIYKSKHDIRKLSGEQYDKIVAGGHCCTAAEYLKKHG